MDLNLEGVKTGDRLVVVNPIEIAGSGLYVVGDKRVTDGRFYVMGSGGRVSGTLRPDGAIMRAMSRSTEPIAYYSANPEHIAASDRLREQVARRRAADEKRRKETDAILEEFTETWSDSDEGETPPFIYLRDLTEKLTIRQLKTLAKWLTK